jgi:hypothetical protein
VNEGGRLLDGSHAPYKGPKRSHAADRKVLYGAHGLGAVQGIGWNSDLAQGISFDPHITHDYSFERYRVPV